MLPPERFAPYVEQFNAHDEEIYPQHIPNAAAWAFLKDNIPLFECPDPELEKTYYFRWWTYRKHIKQTPDGFVITEFLPAVPWAGKHNTINCPAGHHFYEGRWLHDPRFLDDYAVFWFRKGGEPRRYSFWAADALWARHLVTPNPALLTNLLPDLLANYAAWEKAHQDPNGLFWQIDDRDGMEVSVGGSGYRATINSYMFGDAQAIARIASLAGNDDLARTFRAKAAQIKSLVQSRLWDEAAQFFKVAPRPPALQPKSSGILEWRVNHDAELTRSAHGSASHCGPNDSLAALQDGIEPKSSGDHQVPRFTFWDHQGTTEWVQYEFAGPTRLTSTEVYWFQDTAGCRVPRQWRALFRDGERWLPVQTRTPYPIAADTFCRVEFEPVTTTALRLEIVCPGAARDAADAPLRLADVRELHGFTPWYVDLPDARFGVAWKQLMDPRGFYAPFGPTTTEQRHPGFKVAYEGHECQWNGPSWPLSTAVTLTGLANLLNRSDPEPGALTKQDYFTVLRNYALSHRLKRPDGQTVCWIDENLNPFTGDWIARTLLTQRGSKLRERGKDYNHSSFADLVISGLVGLRPRADGKIEVNPLLPDAVWDYFCLDRVRYHGHLLTIVYDRTGERYGVGKGLRVRVDGRDVAARPDLGRLTSAEDALRPVPAGDAASPVSRNANTQSSR